MYSQVSCRTAVTSERPETFHTRNETRCSLRCCWLAPPYWEEGEAEGPPRKGGGGKPCDAASPLPALAQSPAPATAAVAAALAAWAAAMAAEAEVATALEAALRPLTGLRPPEWPGRGCPAVTPGAMPERAAVGALEGPEGGGRWCPGGAGRGRHMDGLPLPACPVDASIPVLELPTPIEGAEALQL